MIYAGDVGHSYFKGIGNGKRALFPSVLGEIHGQFLDQNGYIQVETRDGKWFIGQAAIDQSQNLIRGQDRDWAFSPHYRALLLTGISEVVSPATHDVSVDLVSGLPVADFALRDEIANLVKGTHLVKRPHRRDLVITIKNVLYVPQGLAIFDGSVKDNETVVILDIGGRNINYSTFKGKRAISAKSDSTEKGTLVTVREITRKIKARTGRDLSTDETIEVIKTGGAITSKGHPYDVRDIINEELDYFVDYVRSLISSVWGDTSAVDKFLVAGGGALVVGNRIAQRIEQAKVVDDPQWANAKGYERFGKMKFGAS